MSTPLEKLALRMIAATGPLSIAQYMHLCHSHPQRGYYATGNPLGQNGDFITAPEISQMFGELIAIWAFGVWDALDKPAQFQIAELGPGRGTLMADFVRTAKTNPAFYKAINISLVETSESLRSVQQSTLSKNLNNIIWCEAIEQLQKMPSLFIANEFFDAIPFRQFVKNKGVWCENCVGINNDNKLAYVLGDAGLDENILPDNHHQQPDGAVFEYAPAREALMDFLGSHIKDHGGAGLVIDYGHLQPGFGDTFQAVKSHKPVSPLELPGQCDLTSHVDFSTLGNIATQHNLHIYPIISQGEFLLNLGLLERAGLLGQGKSGSRQHHIQDDVERLAAPDQMGNLFKVFCFSKSELKIPPFNN